MPARATGDEEEEKLGTPQDHKNIQNRESSADYRLLRRRQSKQDWHEGSFSKIRENNPKGQEMAQTSGQGPENKSEGPEETETEKTQV